MVVFLNSVECGLVGIKGPQNVRRRRSKVVEKNSTQQKKLKG